MTHTQQILADIKRHGLITASAIHKLDIDTLLWLEKKEKSK
jgi:hypothetical protein